MNTYSCFFEEIDTESEERYCTIRWLDIDSFEAEVIPVKNIDMPFNSITMYDIYTVKINGQQRRGIILHKGIIHYCTQIKEI